MRRNSSTISSKGQVTVPREVRERLGLKTGDRVEFVSEKGQTIIRPGRGAQNPFQKYVGVLPGMSGIKQINAWVRSLRDEDEEER